MSTVATNDVNLFADTSNASELAFMRCPCKQVSLHPFIAYR